MISRPLSLDDLWNSVSPPARIFESAQISDIPERAQRYLTHAIADGTPLASAVRLRMHGKIKLKGWYPFKAEEVIVWGRGMIWRAAVRMVGLPISGSDSLIDGQGAMDWKLFGIVPIMNVSGSDITRSAAGRINIESVWLPSVLCNDQVSWAASNATGLRVQFNGFGETAQIDYLLDAESKLKSLSMPRWGNADGKQFGYETFGGLVEAEGCFGGYTIPTCMRIGWYFGTNRFEAEGEFFRVTIDEAVYR